MYETHLASHHHIVAVEGSHFLLTKGLAFRNWRVSIYMKKGSMKRIDSPLSAPAPPPPCPATPADGGRRSASPCTPLLWLVGLLAGAGRAPRSVCALLSRGPRSGLPARHRARLDRL
eukprot:scaffold126364_cov28-Tisochrysis_lutea.AAC.1